MLSYKSSSVDSSKILFAVLCVSLLIQLCIKVSLFIIILSCIILVFVRKYKTVSYVLVMIVYLIIVIRVLSSGEDVVDICKEKKAEKNIVDESNICNEKKSNICNEKKETDSKNLRRKDDQTKNISIENYEDPCILVEDFHPTKTYQIILNVEAENVYSVKDEMNQDVTFKTSTVILN
jgi:uncharacterized membrane protein